LDFVHRSLAKELGGPTTGTGDLRQTAMTGDVLDLGCGDGSVSAWIATRKLPVARVPQQHVHRLLRRHVPVLSQMRRVVCRVVSCRARWWLSTPPKGSWTTPARPTIRWTTSHSTYVVGYVLRVVCRVVSRGKET
jgi:hypothetical protein